MQALGRLFDIGLVAPPAATNGVVTGKRIHLTNATGVAFVLVGGVASAGDDLQVDIQQHDAATGGNSKDCDCVTMAYLKDALAMDNTETWTALSQSVASEVAVNASYNTDIHQNILVVEIEATSLDIANGYQWCSLNIPDLGAGDKTLAVLAITHGLHVQRTPNNLTNLNA
jgi:hypothetical protein